MFWFIRHEEQVQFQGTGWDKLLQQWLKLIPASGRFQSVEGQVVTLEDITAKDYVESDPLDLDHLSQ
jgi:Tfp pilus assembly protein PilN